MIIAAATAQAFLATARGDLEGVISAAAAVRATGKARFQGYLRRYDWRSLEIDALIGLGRLGEAETALAELEAVLSPAGPPSALVAAARLRGDLAIAAGHPAAAAAAAFETAWRRAEGLRVPLELAQLEISDARRLRAAGQPQKAVAPAAFGPAAPDQPGCPALRGGLRPGAGRRRRASGAGNRARPARSHPGRAGGGPPGRHRPLQPANRSRPVRQRQNRRVPPRAHLRQARHPIPARPHHPHLNHRVVESQQVVAQLDVADLLSVDPWRRRRDVVWP